MKRRCASFLFRPAKARTLTDSHWQKIKQIKEKNIKKKKKKKKKQGRSCRRVIDNGRSFRNSRVRSCCLFIFANVRDLLTAIVRNTGEREHTPFEYFFFFSRCTRRRRAWRSREIQHSTEMWISTVWFSGGSSGSLNRRGLRSPMPLERCHGQEEREGEKKREKRDRIFGYSHDGDVYWLSSRNMRKCILMSRRGTRNRISDSLFPDNSGMLHLAELFHLSPRLEGRYHAARVKSWRKPS